MSVNLFGPFRRGGRHASHQLILAVATVVVGLSVPSVASANKVTIDAVSPTVYRGGLTCLGRYLNVGVDASFSDPSVVPDATATVVGGLGLADIPTSDASNQHHWHFEVIGIPLDGLSGIAQQLHVHVGSYGTGFGTADKTVPFNIPQEPGLIKPGAKCILKNIGTTISIASGVAAVTSPAGAAGAVAKRVLGGLAIGAGLGVFVANADPPDPDYKSVAQPLAVSLPSLTTGTADQQSTANAVIAREGSLLGHLSALLTAAERSWGASNAGDTQWVKTQQQSEQVNARAAADDLDAVAAAMKPLQDALELGKLDGAFSLVDLSNYQYEIATGAESSINDALDALAPRADIRQTIVAALASEDLSALIGRRYATSLVDVVPALENTAGGLRAWAASFDAPIEAPEVTSVSPENGPAAGGTKVTVHGEHLGAATDVLFGSASATDVHCEATDCIVTSPPGSEIQLVTVLTPAGRSPDNFNARFHYDGPAIAGVSPATGPPGGGNRVTINGGPFVGGTRILFGTQAAIDPDCHVGFCTITAPAGTGTVDVTAAAPDGSSTAASATSTYSYVSPSANLLANGGFEPGDGIDDVSKEGFRRVNYPASVGGWTMSAVPGEILAGGGIELVSTTVAQPYQGSQFLTFGLFGLGTASGTARILQTVPVTPGHHYTLRFAVSGDVNGGSPIKRLRAALNDEAEDVAFDDTNYTQLSQGWKIVRLASVICSSSATVTFDQLEQGQAGPELDDVVLTDDGATSGCGAPIEPPRITSPADGATLEGPNVTLAGTGTPDAMVTVRDETTPVGHTAVDSTGNWSLTIPAAVAGAHTYTATQSMDDRESADSDALHVEIRPPHSASITVACAPAAIVVGERSACTATVTSPFSDPATVSVVTFTTDGPGQLSPEQCQTVPGPSTKSTCSIEYVPVAVGTGTHTITAQTTAEPNSIPSVASTTVSVTHSPTSRTSLRCSPAQVRPGEPVRCSVAVQVAEATREQTPTGTVRFSLTGPGAMHPNSCQLVGDPTSHCRVEFDSIRPGRTTIKATYVGGPGLDGSVAYARVRTILPQGSPHCRVRTVGTLTARNGRAATFEGSASTRLAPAGHERYEERTGARPTRVIMTSSDVAAVTCDIGARRAEIYGGGTAAGGQRVWYVITVVARRHHHGGEYQIRLSSGYDSGWERVHAGSRLDVRGR